MGRPRGRGDRVRRAWPKTMIGWNISRTFAVLGPDEQAALTAAGPLGHSPSASTAMSISTASTPASPASTCPTPWRWPSRSTTRSSPSRPTSGSSSDSTARPAAARHARPPLHAARTEHPGRVGGRRGRVQAAPVRRLYRLIEGSRRRGATPRPADDHSGAGDPGSGRLGAGALQLEERVDVHHRDERIPHRDALLGRAAPS